MPSGDRRLIKGVKEQMRIMRDEEKQRLLEEKNINDDHRKMLKMAAGLTNKVSFGSPRSSTPSVTDEQPLSESMSGPPAARRPSNLTQANVKALNAASDRKHPPGGGSRRTSISLEAGRGAASNSKTKVTTNGSDDFDRLNLEDDDDDDPDMMSLDCSMISGVDIRSERSRKQQPSATADKTNQHGRK